MSQRLLQLAGRQCRGSAAGSSQTHRALLRKNQLSRPPNDASSPAVQHEQSSIMQNLTSLQTQEQSCLTKARKLPSKSTTVTSVGWCQAACSPRMEGTTHPGARAVATHRPTAVYHRTVHVMCHFTCTAGCNLSGLSASRLLAVSRLRTTLADDPS